MVERKKILFVSGTRADYGKLHPIIDGLDGLDCFETYIFATGMHLLERHGETIREIQREHSRIYAYNNQAFASSMDIAVSNTITGLSCYISELKPDMLFVHGDRPEALAGAIVGGLRNILTAHVEGGEISGTNDEMIRHAVSKLCHLHFVANKTARTRLLHMGEANNCVFVVGSPDIDLMLSKDLPSFESVSTHYDIPFKDYSIAVYHSVTTELHNQQERVTAYIDALLLSKLNYVVIQPNNDPGSEIIRDELNRVLAKQDRFRIFPSIRFKEFLSLLKNSAFVIGNSSLGIREAPIYSIPTINIGSRQNNRSSAESILNVKEETNKILQAIEKVSKINPDTLPPNSEFGDGHSVKQIIDLISDDAIWDTPTQKVLNI